MSLIGQFGRAVGGWLPPALVRPLGRPAVLLFHGVERSKDDARVQTDHHDAVMFYRIAKSLKADFDVLPLSQIDDALERPARHARSVFLTSDDGYANTLTVAAEILQALELPWTLFVSTHHVDTGARNPMFLARLFLVFAPDGRYPIVNFPGPIELRRDREVEIDFVLDHLKSLPRAEAEQSLRAMLAVVADDTEELVQRFESDRFLTWDDVATLKSRGVEIGAHAHVHWAMHAGQSQGYLQEQAERSRALVEAHAGTCRYFAYPFGNADDVSGRAWRAVRSAGYSHAFTTMSGSLGTGMNPWLLPRYGLDLRDSAISSLVPLLRAGNPRVRRWQRALEN